MKDFSFHQRLTLVAVATAFFFVYGALYFKTGRIFNSPDETAAYFFSSRFISHGRLDVFDSLNLLVNGKIHPRSVVVAEGFLAPGGFWGLPLIYGFIGRLAGVGIIKYLTAAAAVLAVSAVAGVWRRFFGPRLAFLAGVSAFFHPALWYYASRGLFPNVLFFSLFSLAVFFIIVRPFAGWRKSAGLLAPAGQDEPDVASGAPGSEDGHASFLPVDDLAGGFFAALAFLVRPTEIVWVGPFLMILAWSLLGRKVTLRALVMAVLPLMVAVAVFLIENRVLYGGYFTNGYLVSLGVQIAPAASFVSNGVSAAAGERVAAAGAVSRALASFISRAILPFGFHPLLVAVNLWRYAAAFFWWWTVPVLAGIYYVLTEYRAHIKARGRHFRAVEMPGGQTAGSSARAAYLAALTLAALWLFAAYGSFKFNDHPDPSQVTIGTSYVRYWLPVYILSLPVAFYGLQCLARAAGRRWKIPRAAHQAGAIVFFASLIFLSARATLSGDDGLVNVARNVLNYERVADEVISRTSPEAILIVERADKIFFPRRRVIVGLRDETTYAILPLLVRHVSLYYYGITIVPDEFNKLNAEVFAPRGLRLEPEATFEHETLYRFVKAPQ